MNNKPIDISDELLAKYLSGKTSPEEEEMVLSYLGDNEDGLEDLKNITASVELHHTMQKRNSSKNVWKWVAGIASAAAVAMLVVTGIYFSKQDNGSGNTFVQNQQTSTQQDSLKTVTADTSKVTDADNEINRESPQTPSYVEPKHYADSAKKKNYANMIYPPSKLQSISNQKKSVSFRWNTDAIDVHLSVKSGDERVLIDQKLGPVRYFNFTLPDPDDTLKWQAVFTYADGSSTTKEGTIIRWDVGLKTDN